MGWVKKWLVLYCGVCRECAGRLGAPHIQNLPVFFSSSAHHPPPPPLLIRYTILSPCLLSSVCLPWLHEILPARYLSTHPGLSIYYLLCLSALLDFSKFLSFRVNSYAFGNQEVYVLSKTSSFISALFSLICAVFWKYCCYLLITRLQTKFLMDKSLNTCM